MTAGTAIADDVRPQVDDQLRRLAADPAVERLCGELYPNNFVVVLPSVGVDAQASAAAIGAATSRLNTTDAMLLEWCEDLVGDDPDTPLASACGEWRAHLASGQNLVGAAFAVHVFHELNRSRSLAALLTSQRPDIEQALRNADPRVRDVCRLNGFVPLRIVERLTSLLLTELERVGAMGAVDRIEVAQDLGTEISGPPAITPGFPSLMLYLRPQATAAELELTITIFEALTSRVVPGAMPAVQFATKLGPAATLSQGFRLFKHYLYPLGLLDAVYDVEWSHALTAVPAEPAVAHADALRELLARRAGVGARPGLDAKRVQR